MSARMLAVAAALVASAPLVAPGIGAQGIAPTLELFVGGIPATIALSANGTASFTVEVIVEAANFGCSQPAQIPVVLEVSNAGALPPHVTAVVDPAELVIDVPPGLYTEEDLPVAPIFNESGEATVTVTTTAIPANATQELSLRAHFAGGMPANCQAQGTFPEREALGASSLNLTAPYVPPPPPPPEEKRSFLPGPGAAVAAVAGLAAAALGRGRSARRPGR